MNIIIISLCVLIGICVGSGVLYAILSPKIKQTQELNKEIEISNQTAQTELTAVKEKLNLLNTAYETKLKEYTELQNTIQEQMNNVDANTLEYYHKMVNMYNQKFYSDVQKKRQEYQQAEQQYQKDYQQILTEAAQGLQKELHDIQEQKALYTEQLHSLTEQLEKENATVIAAVEANKRAAEMETKEDFYRLNLSTEDIDEINELRECAKHLRNPEPLNKVIWKVYYEKAYTDLVGRVIGSGVHCGIYKITNIKNNMCYVGQAVNLAERWKQHIKRGLGADTPTRNKLYPAMLKYGVENFTFEVIEECERISLNSKELFWQDYFKAKEFGYSMK